MKYDPTLEDEAQAILARNGRCIPTPLGDLYKVTMPDGWELNAKDTRVLKERMMERMIQQQDKRRE